MSYRAVTAIVALAIIGTPIYAASAAGLGGSMSSMRKQHAVAVKNDFTFLRTPAQVAKFVEKDLLEPVLNDENVVLHDVSYPFARPSVHEFIERLAADYRAMTGEPLVVTSLTRPLSRQPRNAHRLSVHPTGMAVDLRIPANAKARAWLERRLLSLESKGLIDATRERHPAHYHVAVYPDKYEQYASTLPPLPPASERMTAAAENDETGVHAASLEPSDTSGHAVDAAAAASVSRDAGASGLPGAPIAAGLGMMMIVGFGAGVARRRRGDRSRDAESAE